MLSRIDVAKNGGAGGKEAKMNVKSCVTCIQAGGLCFCLIPMPPLLNTLIRSLFRESKLVDLRLDLVRLLGLDLISVRFQQRNPCWYQLRAVIASQVTLLSAAVIAHYDRILTGSHKVN